MRYRLKSLMAVLFFVASAVLLFQTGTVFADDTPKTQTISEDSGEGWGGAHKHGIVLVLSGGGTKGFAHIGVLECLEREQIPIAAIVGTSMGALIGGVYATGYSISELKEVATDMNLMEILSDRSNGRPADVGYNFPPTSGTSLLSMQIDKNKNKYGKTGLLKAKNLYAFINDLTSRAYVTDFNMLPIPFAAVATNLENGNTEVIRQGNLASALRASISIPGIFTPWEMDGKILADGGLKANLPVLEAKKIFPGHPIVAVNLSSKDITVKRKALSNVLEIAAQTLEILMVDQIRNNAAAADIVISPNVSEFGILDSNRYDKIIQRGADAAEPCLPKIQEILKEYETARSSELHDVVSYVPVPIVSNLLIEGVPEKFAAALREKYSGWIGNTLDMKKISDAVEYISSREEVNSVEGKVRKAKDGSVDVIISIERPAKYEFSLGGYVGNIHPDSWLSLSAQVRDIMMDGDVGSLEYRLGNKWGVLGRYFTPTGKNNWQSALVLAAREEGFTHPNGKEYTFERYTARFARYKSFSDRLRFGYGYAFGTVSGGENNHGPYLSLSMNNLDDPVIPSRGIALTFDAWVPIDETPITRTAFQAHIPILDTWRVILSGGLKTGDATEPAYAAILGQDEELYSLSKKPMLGDQAYWVHIGAAKMFLKSWWGAVNAELFGNYGQVLNDWNLAGSWWEVGMAMSVPLNNFSGKVMIVYDQGGEVTFGYSLGVPLFWNSPLP